MGGIGSGSWYRHEKRPTTDDFLRLDVRTLKRKGALTPGQTFLWLWKAPDGAESTIRIAAEEDRLFLRYRVRADGEGWEDVDIPVHLTWTPCHLGGSRPWFQCPRCNGRCAILLGGRYFACRKCESAAYRSQRQSEPFRALDRAQELRARLGACLEVGSPIERPKGMHRRTYERKCREIEAADLACDAAARRAFGVKVALM